MKPRLASARIPTAIAVVAALLAFPARAEKTATEPRPLEIETISELVFGTLVVGSAGGSVRIEPRGNASSRGAVHLRDALQAEPARFTVRGEPGALFDVVLPESIELQDGGRTVLVDEIASDVGFVSALDAAGRAEVAVGATLELPARTPAGRYSGTLTILLAYE